MPTDAAALLDERLARDVTERVSAAGGEATTLQVVTSIGEPDARGLWDDVIAALRDAHKRGWLAVEFAPADLDVTRLWLLTAAGEKATGSGTVGETEALISAHRQIAELTAWLIEAAGNAPTGTADAARERYARGAALIGVLTERVARAAVYADADVNENRDAFLNTVGRCFDAARESLS